MSMDVTDDVVCQVCSSSVAAPREPASCFTHSVNEAAAFKTRCQVGTCPVPIYLSMQQPGDGFSACALEPATSLGCFPACPHSAVQYPPSASLRAAATERIRYSQGQWRKVRAVCVGANINQNLVESHKKVLKIQRIPHHETPKFSEMHNRLVASKLSQHGVPRSASKVRRHAAGPCRSVTKAAR